MSGPTRTPGRDALDHLDERFSWGLIHDIVDVLERYGYERGGDRAVGRMVEHLFELVAAYEGHRRN